MSETIVHLHINQTLYKNAELCARECEMEVPRFLAEVIESYVAARRLGKTVPSLQALKNKPTKDTENIKAGNPVRPSKNKSGDKSIGIHSIGVRR